MSRNLAQVLLSLSKMEKRPMDTNKSQSPSKQTQAQAIAQDQGKSAVRSSSRSNARQNFPQVLNMEVLRLARKMADPVGPSTRQPESCRLRRPARRG